MNYLVVVAHPDDEVLGCGATIARLLKEGHDVHACILSSKCRTRYDMATDDLLDDMQKSHNILGLTKRYVGNCRCLCFKDEPHEETVKFVELAIIDSQADVLITHHPADLNNDHYITSIICQEAARLPQRQLGYSRRIQNILFMEIASATEWALNDSLNKFSPNTFVSVTADHLLAKVGALTVYNNVVRPVPHPRAGEVIMANALLRGAQAGYHYAEAFQSVMRLEI